MGFEHNELRHRALLARFMTRFPDWASRGDNYDALSDLCVCVCELNRINTQSTICQYILYEGLISLTSPTIIMGP